MGHGLYKVYTVTMASGGTLTSEIDLGRAYENVYLQIPAMSNVQLHFQAAAEAGGTYYRICHPTGAAATPLNPDFGIASAATSRIVPIPNAFQVFKIETTATIDNGAVFKVLCAD